MNINIFFFLKLENFTLNVTLKTKDLSILTILGESGSGKTTLLKCITGLITPQKSFLKINNKILQDSKKNIFIKTNKRQIGYIAQTPILFPHLSVYENIIFGLKNKNTYTNANTIINLLNINKLFKRKITDLSGGEKQKILISQVLINQPEVIMLDEPLSSQDVITKKKIIKYIKGINEKFKIPIIWVSHNIHELTMLSDKIIFIKNGKIIYNNL